ncbi:Zinc knuckle [Popillia japonica]|uniref:Zinc knuckle n=1 Tax=Popillia japonica TaxID=7064 RepID=A0AAW1L8K2_POPJA
MAKNVSVHNFPQLNGANFSNWKFRVECLLDEKGVKKTVECLLDEKGVKYVIEKRKQLLLLKCSNDIELQDHFEKFDKLIRELESAGSKMDETDKVCHLLLTMTEKYQSVISARETTTMTLTIEFVKSRLLDYELKLNNEEHSSKIKNSECSLFNVNENRLRKCYTCGSTDHLKPNCPKNKNRNLINVVEIETVNIKIANGETLKANKREKLSHNLLSVSKINEAGFKVTFVNGQAIASKQNVILKCDKVKNLYIINLMLNENTNEYSNNCMLSNSNNMLSNSNNNDWHLRSKRIGELTHSDICGPMFVPTLDNELYYMSVIDDFSHFCKVYLLKNKSDARDYLIEYIEEMNAAGNQMLGII